MSKHTTLDQLKMLAQRSKTEIDKVDTKVTALSSRVDDLVTAGGEPNKIDVIKNNGTALGITDKGVDIGPSIAATVAALAAVRLCPAVRDVLTASHLSAEPGAGYVMDALGLPPLLQLGMALGEGTGAASAMPLIDMALRVYFDMPSFDGIGIDAYQPL